MNKLQSTILSIAKDVDIICKKHNITYFLDGGSALGAVRHKGFIPWDDDFDIILLPDQFRQLVKIFPKELNNDKYSFYQAEVDWPMHISKVKLKGTSIEEIDEFPMADKGIYVDIFSFDYASDIKFVRFFQWLFTRIWVVLMIASKPYTTKSKIKKVAIAFAKLINSKKLRSVVRNLGRSSRPTRHLSMAWARSRKRWTDYFCPVEFFNSADSVQFEDYKFPVASNIDGYLTTCFGNYMQLPPEEKRVGLHVISVDYGKY